jgi:hypothetical protein
VTCRPWAAGRGLAMMGELQTALFGGRRGRKAFAVSDLGGNSNREHRRQRRYSDMAILFFGANGQTAFPFSARLRIEGWWKTAPAGLLGIAAFIAAAFVFAAVVAVW